MYTVVGYFTSGTLYEEKSRSLIESLEKFGLSYYIEGVTDLGSWHKNTAYKPTFLKRMHENFKPNPIVYVDCDARFLEYPDLFDKLSTQVDVDIAVHNFDRSCYRKSAHGFEILSGTIYLACNNRVKEILEAWEIECSKHPEVWDQKSLEKVLNGNFTPLPYEYCTIFDRLRDGLIPVIVHYQASREYKRLQSSRRV